MSMTDQDLLDWPSKQEAADRLGVTVKTIERLTRAGKLERRFRNRPGTSPIAVYDPKDVTTVQAERSRPQPPHVQAAPPAGNGAGPYAMDAALTAAPGTPDVQHVVTILSEIGALFQKTLSHTSHTPSHTAIFLTVEQAAEYLNWTPGNVRMAIQSGELTARKPNRRDWRTWRIRRRDLDAL